MFEISKGYEEFGYKSTINGDTSNNSRGKMPNFLKVAKF